MQKIRWQKNIDIIGVLLVSLVTFWIVGKGNLNLGLFDDNQTQWLPVIDSAYDVLFQTGKLPTIDFFQMKGMKIYDQGYYGLWNPFMLIAYVIRKYLLFFLSTNTITVYIFIMIVLGNICCYKIFREAKVNKYVAIIFSSILLSVSIYIVLRYWYYIYNVYFILTWLIYRILKNSDKRSYYEYGAILSLSLMMGNVQYTVYMYMTFVIIMFLLFFNGEKKAFGKIFSNSICMGILSFIQLLLLLQTSMRSIDFSGNNSGYYSNAVHPISYMIFSWLPSCFFGKYENIIENFIVQNISIPNSDAFPGIRSFYIGAGIFAVVIFLIQRKNYEKDNLYQLANSCFMAIFILLILSFGKIGILSVFVEQIPILNSFRILAKYLVLLPPLFLPVITIVLREQKRKINKYVFFFSIFILCGFIQNRQLIFPTSQIQKEESIEQLKKLKVDYQNYRILSFASYQEISVIYPQWEDFAKREKINLEEKFSKNAATSAKVMTLGGYDLAFDKEQFQMSSHIMQTISGYASEFGYDNMVIEENFFGLYNKGNEGYYENIENLKQQILNNGIKYFIFSKNSDNISKFIEILDDMELEVEWKKSFLKHTLIISVREATPIVVSEKGNKVDVKITMNQITFKGQKNDNYKVSIYYDKNLRVYHIDEKKNKTRLSIGADENGYLLIFGTGKIKDGIIKINYQNKFYMLSQIWNVILGFLIIIMVFATEISWIKNVTQRIEKKIKIKIERIAQICPNKGVWIVFTLGVCFYICFIGFYYFHVQCTVPDEDWFLQIFKTIHHMAKADFFAYFTETENYLGYGQIYWIISSIFPNMYILRTAAFFMLMGSMFLTLREVKIRFGTQMIPYAGLLWLSMPFVWFCDKIIGPEILGLFLGIFGLSFTNRGQKSGLGWVLLGISSAVKMNYIVFAISAMLLALNSKNEKWYLKIGKAGLFGISGFLIGNPIILWDIQTFLVNAKIESNWSFNQLAYIFNRREHEWDGVMVNGIFGGYISAFFLFILIILFIFQNKNNRRKERYYINCIGGSFLLVVLMSCKGIFLGWYLFPLCYYIVLITSDLFYFKYKNKTYKNLIQWSLLICIIINSIFLIPEHIENRICNIKYIQVLLEKEEIIKEVDMIRENLGKDEIDWFYLLDFHMGEYCYDNNDYVMYCIAEKEGVAVIGERMRIIKNIDKVIQKAIHQEKGLKVLWQTDDVWIIQRGNK